MNTLALGGSNSTSVLDLFRQKQDALKAMEAAVKSGDMKTAQSSLVTLQNDSQQLAGATGSAMTNGASSPFRPMMKNDLTSLMQAVQSGDATQSQSALSKLQTDAAGGSKVAGNTDLDGDTDGSSGSSGPGAFLKDLGAMLSSLASGDANGAKSAATSLQADVQSLLGTSAQPAATTATATTTGGDTQQNSFLSDLTSLIGSAQSGDVSTAQKAAQNLAGDIKSALSWSGAHGHHHHHHDADAPAGSAAISASASAPTAATSGGASEGIDDKAAQAALNAYKLLMNFAHAPSNGSSAETGLQTATV